MAAAQVKDPLLHLGAVAVLGSTEGGDVGDVSKCATDYPSCR